MKFHIISKVNVRGLILTHEHDQIFSDDENVFGRVLEYHKYMRKMFPEGEFKLMAASEVK